MDSTFESLQISEEVVNILRDMDITVPSPIQAEAIPAIAQGSDIIAQSQTGTGKTLAYLLPVMSKLDIEAKELQAIVIAPTRELGMQIFREIEALSEGSGVRSQALIGGAAIQRQVERLRLHPHIIVGTPGRILELLKIRKLKMHKVRTITVDEVDQVFDLGSMSEVEEILKGALRSSQILFFSATIPAALDEIAERWMDNPVRIGIETSQKTPEQLEHLHFICEEREKIDTLRRLIRLYNPPAVIVFVNEINSIAELAAKLQYMDISAEALHGEADKQERAVMLQRFREGKFQVLIATDIAARGLDIKGLTHIINFDPPIDADHYVHRVGRTGRMGQQGVAISIITSQQQFIIDKFEKALDIVIKAKQMFKGQVIPASAERPVSGAGSFARPNSASEVKGAPRTTGTASSRSASVSPPGRMKKAKSADKGKSGRHRDRINSKDKGAPKWLKEKRGQDK